MKNSSKEKKDKIYTGHFRQEEMLMVKKKKRYKRCPVSFIIKTKEIEVKIRWHVTPPCFCKF